MSRHKRNRRPSLATPVALLILCLAIAVVGIPFLVAEYRKVLRINPEFGPRIEAARNRVHPPENAANKP